MLLEIPICTVRAHQLTEWNALDSRAGFPQFIWRSKFILLQSDSKCSFKNELLLLMSKLSITIQLSFNKKKTILSNKQAFLLSCGNWIIH